MPLSFDQIVTAVQVRVADHSLATDALVGTWVNEAHAELLESDEWARQKNEIIILTTAEESTGTFSVTNGSATISGTGTSLSSADDGKYIRFGSDNEFYVAASSGTALTDFNGTSTVYAGSTATAATYVMWQRWYNLGAATEHIYAPVYKQELKEMLIGKLDWIDALRTTTGDPTHYILGPRNSTDLVQFEFFPRPTGTIAITFGVLLGHTDLSGSNLPIVPGPVLIWETATIACHYIYARTREKGFLDLVDKYEVKKAVARELVANQDEKKFGLPHHLSTRDSAGLTGTDFELDKDLWL